MGKRSIKENKNIYQISREELDLPRAKASELMRYISPDRIEKIENEKSLPHPDEVLIMADSYKKPELPNYYCSHECPIGQKYIPEIEKKDLSQIVLEVLGTLNSIERQKNRLIDITMDGEITDDEYKDFVSIQKLLTNISLTVDALQLWIEKSMVEGKLDKTTWEKIKNSQP